MGKKDRKLTAAEWLPIFVDAGIRADELGESKSKQAKSIKIGQFLSPNVGRTVAVEVGGRVGKAVLRVEQDRSKMKRYYFEFSWDATPQEEETGKKKAKKTGKAGGKQKDTPSGKKKPETSTKTPSKKVGGGSSDAASAGSKKSKTTGKTARKTAKGNAEAWG